MYYLHSVSAETAETLHRLAEAIPEIGDLWESYPEEDWDGSTYLSGDFHSDSPVSQETEREIHGFPGVIVAECNNERPWWGE
jgi:hypothetical protein